MNFKYYFLILLFVFFNSKAQENIFLSPDKNPKCNLILEGKFKSTTFSQKDWYMTVLNNIQIEYYENGKKNVKFKREFLNDCEYKITVIEKSDENFPVNIGDVSFVKIIETQCNFIKIKYTDENLNKEKEFEFVLEKLNN